MLSAGQVHRIRSMYFGSGVPIRQIARDMGISRNTVRRWIREDREPRMRVHPVQISPAQAFLRAHRREVWELFALCGGSCPRLALEIDRRWGQRVGLRMLQRFCQSFRTEAAASWTQGFPDAA